MPNIETDINSNNDVPIEVEITEVVDNEQYQQVSSDAIQLTDTSVIVTMTHDSSDEEPVEVLNTPANDNQTTTAAPSCEKDGNDSAISATVEQTSSPQHPSDSEPTSTTFENNESQDVLKSESEEVLVSLNNTSDIVSVPPQSSDAMNIEAIVEFIDVDNDAIAMIISSDTAGSSIQQCDNDSGPSSQSIVVTETAEVQTQLNEVKSLSPTNNVTAILVSSDRDNDGGSGPNTDSPTTSAISTAINLTNSDNNDNDDFKKITNIDNNTCDEAVLMANDSDFQQETTVTTAITNEPAVLVDEIKDEKDTSNTATTVTVNNIQPQQSTLELIESLQKRALMSEDREKTQTINIPSTSSILPPPSVKTFEFNTINTAPTQLPLTNPKLLSSLGLPFGFSSTVMDKGGIAIPDKDPVLTSKIESSVKNQRFMEGVRHQISTNQTNSKKIASNSSYVPANQQGSGSGRSGLKKSAIIRLRKAEKLSNLVNPPANYLTSLKELSDSLPLQAHFSQTSSSSTSYFPNGIASNTENRKTIPTVVTNTSLTTSKKYLTADDAEDYKTIMSLHTGVYASLPTTSTATSNSYIPKTTSDANTTAINYKLNAYASGIHTMSQTSSGANSPSNPYNIQSIQFLFLIRTCFDDVNFSQIFNALIVFEMYIITPAEFIVRIHNIIERNSSISFNHNNNHETILKTVNDDSTDELQLVIPASPDNHGCNANSSSIMDIETQSSSSVTFEIQNIESDKNKSSISNTNNTNNNNKVNINGSTVSALKVKQKQVKKLKKMKKNIYKALIKLMPVALRQLLHRIFFSHVSH